MKRITIGIMGGLVNNENMGCVALTYSILQLLEKIKKESNGKFSYIIFDYYCDKKGLVQLCNDIGIETSSITLAPIGEVSLFNLKKYIKAIWGWKINLEMLKRLNQCDLVIDITQGDSFTDLYGKDRFFCLTNIKRIVEYKKIPLILAPQTYGPFESKRIKKIAKSTIEKSKLVMARDAESKRYIESFCDINVVEVTDLAFGLKYSNKIKENNEMIKIGINPSGLLTKNKVENTEVRDFLAMDYDEYIIKLISLLQLSGKYEIHLISHVGNEASIAFPNIKNVIYHNNFFSPIDAKNVIAGMDIFIGARMHATIAAFSAGVATIPLAYSKKFKGLFETLGYVHTIDLRMVNTEMALKCTLDLIENYTVLEKEVNLCMNKINEKYQILYKTLKEEILKYC